MASYVDQFSIVINRTTGLARINFAQQEPVLRRDGEQLEITDVETISVASILLPIALAEEFAGRLNAALKKGDANA
jgi:hypothetical protein